jgi:hypothetical protein
MSKLEAMLSNVTTSIDDAMGAQQGTTAKGAGWLLTTLAVLAVATTLTMVAHWLYSQRKKQEYFRRLRHDFVDRELELESLNPSSGGNRSL